MVDRRFWRAAQYGVPAVFLLWLLIALSSSRETSPYAPILRHFRDERTVFVEDFMASEVDGAFNGSAIAELCSSRNWTQGLVLSCEAVPGGIGEVRNGILNCVRTAIEMGAAVVLPAIVKRSVIDLADLVPGDNGPRRGVPLAYFFDHDHLVGALAAHCPQLAVHDNINVFYAEPTMLEAVPLDVLGLPDVAVAVDPLDKAVRVLDRPAELAERIRARLDAKSPPGQRRYPFHVHMRPLPTLLYPALTMDTPAVYRSFGRLLRVRADLRRLAAGALFNLHKAFQLSLDPRAGLRADSFAAVELRTERDVQTVAHYPSYTEQASDALSFVTAHNMSVVFATTGATADDLAAFVARGRDFGLVVLTAGDLVEGADAATLSGLSYDQRGLVDYEIAMRAGLFAGSAHSLFAWELALRRTRAFGTGANSSHLDGAVCWHDQYSTLYGKAAVGTTTRRSIWP